MANNKAKEIVVSHRATLRTLFSLYRIFAKEEHHNQYRFGANLRTGKLFLIH